ncbi:hypothetical protein BC828DRAFT_49170 [Blastocladiella britannica]|nr:hypothetical protein BC828DRAFT_49170 [Blastocladiella britannica]
MPHSEHLHRRRGRRAHSPLRQYRHHKRHPKHHRTATLLLFLLALVLASVASPHGIPMSVPIITGGTEQQQHPHHPHVSSNHRLPRPRSFPDTPAHGCMLPAPHMLPSESSSTSPQSLLARLGRRLPGHQNAFHLSGGDSGAGDAAPEPVHSQFRVPNWSASSPPLRGSDATSQSNDENTWSASAAAGASGDAFVVDFECVRPPNSDPTYCARVQRAISRSCARVASEIKFKVPVRVAAVLFLPCDSPRPSASCPESHVLGSGAALQSWPVRHLDDKQVYMYPSALVKQLDLHPAQDTEGQTVRWPEFDVLVRFNSLVEFWFGDSDNNGEKRDLAASERDFEYAFTHELLHGLGFGEDLLMRQVPDPRGALLAPSWESTPPSVVPAPMEFSVPWSIYSAETAFFRFARPSIWNRYLFFLPFPSKKEIDTATTDSHS